MWQNKNTSVYSTPFSAGYWKAAVSELHSLRSLTVAAVFLALSLALGMIRIPLGDNLHIFLTFFVKMLGGAIYGPVLALINGFLSDILGYIITPASPFFFGYTLSTMAGSLLYALFLYRARISAVRIFSAKLTVNVLVNILMGSCWSAMLYGKGYLYYLVKSVVKNLALWPLESLLFLLFIQLLLPMLTKRRYLFGNPDGKLFEGKYLFRENGAAHNVKFTAKLLNALGLIVFTAFAVVRFYDAPVWTEGLLRALPFIAGAVLTPFAANILYTFGAAAEDVHAIRKQLEENSPAPKE